MSAWPFRGGPCPSSGFWWLHATIGWIMANRRRVGSGPYRGAGVVLIALVMAAMSPAAVASEGTATDPPPFVWDPVGALTCGPTDVLVGGSLSCTATGASDMAELAVRLELWVMGGGWTESVSFWEEERVEAVGADGSVAVVFAIPDGSDGGLWLDPNEPDLDLWWWASADGWGGPRQDCYVVEHETEQLLHTGPLESEHRPGVEHIMATTSFVVGGQRFEMSDARVVCRDSIHFGGFDEGRVFPAVAVPIDPPVDAEAGPPADADAPPATDGGVAPPASADAAPATPGDDAPGAPATADAAPAPEPAPEPEPAPAAEGDTVLDDDGLVADDGGRSWWSLGMLALVAGIAAIGVVIAARRWGGAEPAGPTASDPAADDTTVGPDPSLDERLGTRSGRSG